MLIGKKLGMTRVFNEEGKSLPVTVIKASPCFVIDRRTEERDGYTAYVMGFGEKKEKRVKKPVLGLCKKAGVPPVEIIREFRATDTSTFEVGEKIPVSVLQKGDRIDVVGWSKGRGFQGVVKRWGFSGGPGSHGSTFHRAPGSAGAGTYPGRVLKGKKFPGRMGNERITVRNLEVVSLDEENGLIVVKGAVPGFTNGLLLIKIGGDIDISARKELAKEQAKKAKEKCEKKESKDEIEEKATAAAEEEEEAEGKSKKAKKEKAKSETATEEASVEEKTEEAKKEEKVEAATPKAKEKVEEKSEEKALKPAKDKEEVKESEDSIEKAAEEAEGLIEEKVEAKKEKKAEEATGKAEEEKEEVKNEDAKGEKADKKDKSKKKGDS
jgi:large subunit ribosomal protein L3